MIGEEISTTILQGTLFKKKSLVSNNNAGRHSVGREHYLQGTLLKKKSLVSNNNAGRQHFLLINQSSQFFTRIEITVPIKLSLSVSVSVSPFSLSLSLSVSLPPLNPEP
jgi:hypothetical protein